MKKLTITLIFGLLLTGFSVSLKAQATVNATASAELVEALTADEKTELNFGRFLPGETVGKIIVANTLDGTRTKDGGVVLISGGNPASAEFRISGYPSSTVNVSLPGDNSVNLTRASSSDELTVETFTTSDASPTLNSAGEATIYVGGSLTIKNAAAGLTKGIYTGSYTVTFQYP